MPMSTPGYDKARYGRLRHTYYSLP